MRGPPARRGLGEAQCHPDLFDRAFEYEEKVRYRRTAMKGRNYPWSQGESLPELIERKDEIKAKRQAVPERAAKRIKPNRPWQFFPTHSTPTARPAATSAASDAQPHTAAPAARAGAAVAFSTSKQAWRACGCDLAQLCPRLPKGVAHSPAASRVALRWSDVASRTGT